MASDNVFRVNLERSRIYWDYYKSMFVVFSVMLMFAALSTMIAYHKGALDFMPAVGLTVFFFLCVILLSAVMSLVIWRHENKFLDEMVRQEMDLQEAKPLV
ncbi:MAG: hypothetical protein NTU61_02435 [Candidatus Altiarchaeota archaeon]|nr:hypothetical protein [Candidatus Altiarchaeota archaeon]